MLEEGLFKSRFEIGELWSDFIKSVLGLFVVGITGILVRPDLL